MNQILYWYPVCSTCKKAKKWLEENAVEVTLRDIKAERPSLEELRSWVQTGLPVKKLLNTSAQLYRSLGLKGRLPELETEEILRLLASDGMLVKRPVLVLEKKALTGFRETEWEEALKEAGLL